MGHQLRKKGGKVVQRIVQGVGGEQRRENPEGLIKKKSGEGEKTRNRGKEGKGGTD